MLDTLSLTLFHEYDKGIQSEVEVDDQLWTTSVASVMCLLQNKVMFLPLMEANLHKWPLARTPRVAA